MLSTKLEAWIENRKALGYEEEALAIAVIEKLKSALSNADALYAADGERTRIIREALVTDPEKL